MRRISDLHTLGEVDVLGAAECEEVAGTVLELRDQWVSRSLSGSFATLGVNAYMDLASSADPDASYFGQARRANAVLEDCFAHVHTTLAGILQDELGLVVRYAEDLALPGFHIWVGDAIPQRPEASVHFDLQYRRLLDRPQYAGATGTVSFTLPVRLPAAGSSLRVWPGYRYPDDARQVTTARETEPEVVPYRVGSALVHSGHLLHQIGVTPSVRPDDLRITLQGHGLVIDDQLILYW
jgi:hypothetical protein